MVANELDAKLDWSTLQLESTSHSTRVAIENGNKMEFIFENIHLPDSTTDEPGSHGFIAYKIKPKSNVVVGDVFSNTANIFFDFNEAIVTNTATTEIVNALGVEDYKLSNYSVYPNPTSGVLVINSKIAIAQIEVYNYLGQVVMENTKQDTIDISNLDTGLYFIKIKDINGDSGIEKVLKK
ncbi:MAG: T9SS type A sorting domain-containing protein [Flavobacteriaceae bacterium]|nr:T9SS type A sorting domain-containing protein [Flavobacteriaceae bacterium]